MSVMTMRRWVTSEAYENDFLQAIYGVQNDFLQANNCRIKEKAPAAQRSAVSRSGYINPPHIRIASMFPAREIFLASPLFLH